jgi:DNA helicase-2/ATP-dependent DNA helicase PcrA
VKGRLGLYRDLVEDLRSASRQTSIEDLMEQLYVKSGLWEHFESEGTFESQGRLENLSELKNSTSPYTDLPPPTGLLAFLDRVSLIADTDKLEDGGEASEGRVTLMTVHAAKGLEFPVVLVVGMDEELFPHARARLFEKDLEEERRLAYVAITRAREKLYLLRARRRMRSGIYQDAVPSRFLRQIPSDLITGDTGGEGGWRPDTGPVAWSPDEPRVVYDSPGGGAWRSRFEGGADRGPNRGPAQGRRASPPKPDEERVVLDEAAAMLSLGTRVLHPQFGEGVVKSLDGPPENLRATVFFRRGGSKRLYVRFAQLEILSH